MKVRISPHAFRDLDGIAGYIAQDNPERAASFVEELKGACLMLGRFPEAFPLLEGHESQGVRHHVHGRYQIFYRIMPAPAQVRVLRILHSSQDFASVIF